MKNRNLFYAGISLLLSMGICVSCVWSFPDGPTEHSIDIFLPADSIILQKVRVKINSSLDSTYQIYLDEIRGCYFTKKYCIPIYPKLYENAPLFTKMDDRGDNPYGFVGTSYDICELATQPKFIALKGGYYMAYPYNRLIEYVDCLDINWEQLCDVDLDTIPLLPNNQHPFDAPYKEVYNIQESTIAKLAHKSTIRFRKRNKEEVTIEDAVEVINRLIEEGKLEEYGCGRNYYPNTRE